MDNNNFTPWAGGPMPVPHGTEVEVIHRDGEKFTSPAGEGYAEDWGIDPDAPDAFDIVAYRVLA